MHKRPTNQKAKTVAALISIISLLLCANPANAKPQLFSQTFNRTIPSGNSSQIGILEVQIDIPLDNIITDLNVNINIEHDFVFDLQIFIISPQQTAVCLNSYNLSEIFTGQNYINATFDDQALTSIKNALAPFTGNFKPLESLSAFTGQNAKGTWTVRIYDLYAYNQGTLQDITLTLNHAPEPATLLILSLIHI